MASYIIRLLDCSSANYYSDNNIYSEQFLFLQ